MRNETGSATLFSIMLVLMISLIALFYLNFEIQEFKTIRERLRVFTCMKKLNGESITHVKRMEMLNTVITLAETGKYAGLLLGPAGAAIAFNSAKAARKGAQAFQEGFHFSYMKNLWELTQKNCHFDPLSYITPYKHKGLLKRDFLGRAQLRKENWNQASFNEQILLKTKVSKKGYAWKLHSESYEIEEVLSLLKSL